MIGVSINREHGTYENAITIVISAMGFGGQGLHSKRFDKGEKEIEVGVLNLLIKWTTAP